MYFHYCRAVQNKVASVMKSIASLGKLTLELRSALRCSQNMSEVEHLVSYLNVLAQ